MAIPGFTAEAAIAPPRGADEGQTVPRSGPSQDSSGQPAHRVSLPGFISSDADVGLGDVIKRMTSTVGIRACGGCLRRAQALNSWLVFSKRSRT